MAKYIAFTMRHGIENYGDKNITIKVQYRNPYH